MKKSSISFILIIILTLAVTGHSQQSSYYSRYNFLMTAPGVYEEGLLGMTNPANLTFLKNPEFRFHWGTEGIDGWSIRDWGALLGFHGLGWGIIHHENGDFRANQYRLALGFGSYWDAVGIGYSWNSGDDDQLGYEKLLTIGNITRLNRHLSVGLIGSVSLESKWNEAVAEIGIRPLGTRTLTLFADGAIEHSMKFSDVPWSAGAIFEAAPGINLVGRYFENETFTLGVSIDFGYSGVGAQSYYDTDQNLAQYSYSVRVGGMRPSIFPEMMHRNMMYVPLNLKGRIDYNRYVLFDSGTMRFMDILNDIKAAENDPRVAAIVLNLSGLRIRPEHAWEIRQELMLAREAGKRVIAFIDEAAMTAYHLASAADVIVMDPSGDLQLPGYITGRTYLKGTLDKLGLGFDEWRFYKYKAGAEKYSRSEMSEADGEQNQAYIDDWYESVRDDICRERNFTTARFDSLIDETAYFMADMALEAGLVDTLARWSDKSKIIRNLFGVGLMAIAPDRLMDNALQPGVWGRLDRIAVVYGLGACEMDHGIRARWLEQVLLSLARNRSVRAVVFRVDSPGGLAMPSSIVAHAVKKCAEKKPVIVSQGQVAASGGYFISAYADSIVAGLNTVTGSIGIYGGWVYDKYFGSRIGMTSDYRKRGEHADLGFGIRLPFTGLQIPSRNLTDEEQGKMEIVMKKYYEDFVANVAAGRKMPVDDVNKIAEGHFYSGLDGKELGLVDKIGGLMTAIEMARSMAGVDKDREIEIIEIPNSKGFINFERKFNPIGFALESDPVYNYLRLLTENPGQPLPMLQPGTYPEME